MASPTSHPTALLEGPILRSLVKIAWPVILSNLLQSAYITVDAFWVGRLGEDAVAAVSISQPINFLAFALGSGLSMAGTILIAQLVGAGERRQASTVAAQVFMMALLFALPLMLLGELCAPLLLHLLHVEQNVYSDALAFLRITLGGVIFTYGFFMLQSMMRGAGQVKIPMLITLGTVILNAIIDPPLIFGCGPVPAMGVAGAGIATLITQAMAMFIGIVIFNKGSIGIHIHLRDMWPNPTVMMRALKLGLPSSIELSARALGANAMMFLVAAFGTVTTAAYGVVNNINMLVIIPALGLSMATSTLVGQNIGAQQLARARAIGKLSAVIAFISLSVVGIITVVAAPALIGIFTPEQHNVIQLGSQFLYIIAPTYGLIGLQMALSGAFRAAGRTMVTMKLALISQWLVQIPLAWVLSRDSLLDTTGLWWAFPLTNLLMAVITIIWYRQIDWQKARLVRGGPQPPAVPQQEKEEAEHISS